MTTTPNMERLTLAARALRDAKAHAAATSQAVAAARSEHRRAEEALAIANHDFEQAAAEEFGVVEKECNHVA